MKKLLIIIFLFISVFSFWKINEQNYTKQKEIKKELINHPENLPKSDIAKITSFWFKNLKADYYWLQTIQYIWSNAFHSEYKKYLFHITNLVTDINPYFEHPYVISQLLLPDYNPRYEDLNNEEQKKHIDEAIIIWKKWVDYFCDKKKIEKIDQIENLENLWTSEELSNVCNSYKPAYYLAFNYYQYLKDAKSSALYYKIAWISEDAPTWAKVMAAIMQWKWWDREKSYFMFLNLSLATNTSNNEVCTFLANEMSNLWVWVFLNWNIKLDSKLIETISSTTKEAIWPYKELEKNKSETRECFNYIYKASRELNLAYIDEANKNFFNDNWRNAEDQDELFNKWYLDYYVEDYQQYDDYWIKYIYNEELDSFDYDIKIKK